MLSLRLPYRITLGLLLSAGLWFTACDPDQDFMTGDGVNIRFELDTLRFDTVFTELGSATRSVKIYNDGDEPVKLDEIYVEGMTGVEFIFNADGVPGGLVEDAIIWDNDSIYVFVEVTIDPDEPVSASPFVIEDRLVVKTGAKEQSILLEAWGSRLEHTSTYTEVLPKMNCSEPSTTASFLLCRMANSTFPVPGKTPLR